MKGPASLDALLGTDGSDLHQYKGKDQIIEVEK